MSSRPVRPPASAGTGVSPRRLFAVTAALVLAIGIGLVVLRAGGAPLPAVVAQGVVEVVLIGLVAGPFAAMVHLLSGSNRQAALRAVTAWGVVVTGLLLMMAGSGDGLMARFGAFGLSG